MGIPVAIGGIVVGPMQAPATVEAHIPQLERLADNLEARLFNSNGNTTQSLKMEPQTTTSNGQIGRGLKSRVNCGQLAAH